MKTKATIIDCFDLGYLLELENGKPAQLRVVEMKGEELEYHLKSEEAKLFGKEIIAEIIFEDHEQVVLSQFSKEERDEKERIYKLEQKALEEFQIGQQLKFQVSQEYDWGFICEEIEGFLKAAINEKSGLKVNDNFLGEIIEKTESGYPVIKQIKA